MGHFLSGVLDFFPSGVDSSMDISRENIQKLIDLRGFYQVTGRHPGYKKFDNGLR